MNIHDINRLIEALYDEDPGMPDDRGPEPLNKRFSWRDPVSGQKPPKIENDIVPTQADIDSLGQDPLYAEPSAPSSPGELDDRAGTLTLDDMVPKSEMATEDDLHDYYYYLRNTVGQEKALEWIKNYRSAEFESLAARIASILLS